MDLDLKKGFQRARRNLQNFEIKSWMVIAVVAVMVGLLALGLVAWIIPPAAEQVTELVATATPTTAPTQAPTPTLAPTPTVVPSPTPIPPVYVVWTEKVSVYLLSDPGAGIIAAIPNGEPVEIRADVAAETVGGLTWRPVRYQMVAGWLATGNLFRMQSGYLQVQEPGTSLFRDPAGAVESWLAPGTPYHPLELDAGEQWQKIALPDGSTGWVNRYAEAIP